MLDSAIMEDSRTQPWRKWYSPSSSSPSTESERQKSTGAGGVILFGNNGNDTHARHVFGTLSPGEFAARYQKEVKQGGEEGK